MRLKKGPPDFVLFITTLALVGMGLIMVFSSSAVTANVENHSPYYFFQRQLLWALIGLVVMIVLMRINYLRLRALAFPLMVVAIVCLLLVLTPLGVEGGGSTRALGLGGLSFTPSELAKLAVVMFLAKTMEINIDKIRSFKNGVLPYLLVMAAICALVIVQPDLGTAFVIAGTIFGMLLVAGARWLHLGLLGVAGAGAVALAIIVEPTGSALWLIDPWKYPTDKGYQTIQSLYALGSGGLFGVGLGRSRQNFSICRNNILILFCYPGEELGLWGPFSSHPFLLLPGVVSRLL